MGRHPYAMMITNFDSTEQKRAWEQLTSCQEGIPDAPALERLWLRNGAKRPCERLLNERTSIATYFAGIIRTAYMYCPRIMLTDAQLFDGLFFVALGPTTVNGILGKSYKDGPAIVISGRHETLEECLVAFTISTVGEVRKAAKDADPSIRPTDLGCAGEDSQHTLRPLEYCVFGHTVTRAEALGFDRKFYDELDARLAQAKTRGTGMTQVIAEAYAQALHPEHDAGTWHRFLAQRWQEWIDAERQGLVLYENQNDPEVIARTASKGFGTYFREHADRCLTTMRRHYKLPDDEKLKESSTVNDENAAPEECFARALTAISNMPKRSDAFMCIDRTNLPAGMDSNGSDGGDVGNDVNEHNKRPLTRRLLRDWYQFVYQRALASHLGAYLIAVSAPENSFEQIIGREAKSTGSSLVLDGAITDALGAMPFNRFSTFCYESRSAIAKWRACTPETPRHEQRVSTRNVAYAVQQAAEERSLADDGKNMMWGALVAGVLALISALSDNVWLNGNAPIWLIVLAAWIIAIVPNIIDVIGWLWGVRTSAKTVVYLG